MRLGAFALAFVVGSPVLVAGSARLFDGSGMFAGTGGLVSEAHASVSILMSLDELARISDRAVLATARERVSRWEELEGGRRIVTYTRLSVSRTLFTREGSGKDGSEIWVRTLGGVVDKIGQSVSGEAQLTLGSESLLFVTDVGGVDVVTGRAQGHYPVVRKDGEAPKLEASPDAGTLLPRQGPAISAREILVGATLDEAVSETLAARRRHDDQEEQK